MRGTDIRNCSCCLGRNTHTVKRSKLAQAISLVVGAQFESYLEYWLSWLIMFMILIGTSETTLKDILVLGHHLPVSFLFFPLQCPPSLVVSIQLPSTNSNVMESS
jgi:hypothetical protein